MVKYAALHLRRLLGTYIRWIADNDIPTAHIAHRRTQGILLPELHTCIEAPGIATCNVQGFVAYVPSHDISRRQLLRKTNGNNPAARTYIKYRESVASIIYNPLAQLLRLWTWDEHPRSHVKPSPHKLRMPHDILHRFALPYTP